MSLDAVARELAARLANLFLRGRDGARPCDGGDSIVANDPQLLRFNEYFHGETGRGLGASFQGWTTLVTRCLEDLATRPSR